MRKLDKRALALLLLLVTGLAWGYNWVEVKVAVAYAPPFTFAAMRLLGGGLVLALVGLALRRPLRPDRPWTFYAIVGLLQSAGFVGLATWAVVMTGAGKVAVLAYTMPIWAALLAWPLLGERIGLRKGLAILIACIGILCMVGPLNGAWQGDALAVLAGLSWALGMVYVKRAARVKPVDVFAMSLWQMLAAGAMLAVIAAFAHGGPVVWSGPFVVALLYNALIATALAYSLWFVVLSILPASEAAVGSLLAPLVGVAATWIQLAERPPPLEGAGMALVLCGIGLLSYRRAAKD